MSRGRVVLPVGLLGTFVLLGAGLFGSLTAALVVAGVVLGAAGISAAIDLGRHRGDPRFADFSTPEEARSLIRETTRILNAAATADDRRAAAELAQAQARTLLALRSGPPHELRAALESLRRAAEDPAADPAEGALAADDLVNAMSVATKQLPGPQGYDEAQRLLEDRLRRAPEIRNSARLYAHRSAFHLFLSGSDTGHFGLALAEQEQAVQLAGRPHPPDLARLGVLLSRSRATLGIDRSADAVARCREAAALDAGDETALALATCLCHCASACGPAGPESLAWRSEAQALLRRLGRKRGPLGRRARELLVATDFAP